MDPKALCAVPSIVRTAVATRLHRPDRRLHSRRLPSRRCPRSRHPPCRSPKRRPSRLLHSTLHLFPNCRLRQGPPLPLPTPRPTHSPTRRLTLRRHLPLRSHLLLRQRLRLLRPLRPLHSLQRWRHRHWHQRPRPLRHRRPGIARASHRPMLSRPCKAPSTQTPPSSSRPCRFSRRRMKTTPFDKLEAIRIVAACTLTFRMSNTIRPAMAHGKLALADETSRCRRPICVRSRAATVR